MKVKHLLLLLTRHRITVTLSGVLFITVISSLVFVQNVFGQNPLVQMYETIQPLASLSSDTDAESEESSSDIRNLSDTIQVSAPADTGLAVTAEPEVPITDAPITDAPITQPPVGEVPTTPAPVAETPVAAPETMTDASSQSTAPVVAAETAQPSAEQKTPAQTTPAQTTPETIPEAEAPEPAAETLPPAEAAPATPTPTVETSAGSYDSTMANSVLDVVNRVRSDNALPALVWNSSLASSARIRAQEAVILWDHNRPDGSEWWTAGDQMQMAENLGKLQSSAEGVVSDWMNSPTHAANILNGSYTNMGVACYYCDGTYYWAQEFY